MTFHFPNRETVGNPLLVESMGKMLRCFGASGSPHISSGWDQRPQPPAGTTAGPSFDENFAATWTTTSVASPVVSCTRTSCYAGDV